MRVSTEDRQIGANQHMQVLKRPHNRSLMLRLHHTSVIILPHTLQRTNSTNYKLAQDEATQHPMSDYGAIYGLGIPLSQGDKKIMPLTQLSPNIFGVGAPKFGGLHCLS